MSERNIPVINPDNNDLSNELFEGVDNLEVEQLSYHPVKSILLVVTALLCFSCMDSTVKYLAMRYNAPLVVAIRYIVHCLLMVIILMPSQGVKLMKTTRTWLVIIRGACLMIASLAVGSALKLMPVAEMTAIVFLAPMMVMLMARPFLGEKIGVVGWLAAVLGFAGVLIIVRPGSGMNTTAIGYMVIAVVANAFYQLLSRVLANTETTITMLFYAALIGAVGLGVTLPWHWEGEAPDLLTYALFLSIGITGGLGHYLYTKAFRYAPASMLAPINYLQLLWAGLLGWMVFGDIPDEWSTIGMIIVAVSGGLVAVKSVGSDALIRLFNRKNKSV